MLNTMVLTKDGKKYNLVTQQVGFFLSSNKVSQIMLVTDNSFHSDDDWDYWNEVTWNEARHYLHESFPNLLEKEH